MLPVKFKTVDRDAFRTAVSGMYVTKYHRDMYKYLGVVREIELKILGFTAIRGLCVLYIYLV